MRVKTGRTRRMRKQVVSYEVGKQANRRMRNRMLNAMLRFHGIGRGLYPSTTASIAYLSRLGY